MTMLEPCRQQDLCHLESSAAKSFISKMKHAFWLGQHRHGGVCDCRPQAPAPRICPTVVHDRFTSFRYRGYNRVFDVSVNIVR